MPRLAIKYKRTVVHRTIMQQTILSKFCFSLQKIYNINIIVTKMSKRLKDKVAIVTGASSGIGRAIAIAFHREGAEVICADLQESSSRVGNAYPTHEAIVNEGGVASFVKTDVTVASDIENLIQVTVKTAGRLDMCVTRY
jgi:5,10-methylene-tetrahydrofolate dehydrogenase/methenyl tetrahydrofolate cyclohydrolase